MKLILTVPILLFISCSTILSDVNPARANNKIKGPERWEEVIKHFEAVDAVKPPNKGEVLLIGGSNARRWKDVDKYLPQHSVLNRGFGGARLYEILHYFDRLVVPHEPQIIILNAGGNDMNSGRSPEDVQDTARAFMKKVQAKLPGTKVYYIGLPYMLKAKQSPEMVPVLHQFNDAIAKLAQDNEQLEFIHIFPSLLDKDQQPRPDLYVEDGVHFTDRAYKIIADLLNEKM